MVKIKIRTLLMVIALIFGFAFVVTTFKENTATENPTPETESLQATPRIWYDRNSTDRMKNLMRHRRPLSVADNNVKERLKRVLPQKTATYSIEYVEPDDFIVEILTTDINAAKEESVTWLKGEGLSGAGICNLPVIYYLNYDVAKKLQNQNIQFNPLPPGC